jgi:chemotaxis receptor (MCP) glutamine deamidase CheD
MPDHTTRPDTILFPRRSWVLSGCVEEEYPPPRVTLHIGDLHASATPVRIATILGSCISACLYDTSTGIGGMNHFLLPGETGDPHLSTRYGINAMEVLINEMMKLGANRRALRAKIFGGADIFRANHPLLRVGQKNIEFVRRFLAVEGIPVVGAKVGGGSGMVVHYFAHAFEVLVKPVSAERFHLTEEEELRYREKLTEELPKKVVRSVTLF